MPLDFQVVQTPFRLGIEEGVDPHHVPLGTLTTAENVVWAKQNQVRKRFGTTRLTRGYLNGGSIAAGSRLFTRGSELCLIDGSYLYSYSSTQATWIRTGKVPDVGLTSSVLLDTFQGVLSADIGVSGNIIVHAWVSGDPTGSTNTGSLWYQIVDRSTGTLLVPPTSAVISTVQSVKVLVIGSTAVIVYLLVPNIAAFSVDLTTFTPTGSTNLRTDVSTANGWDAIVYGSNFYIGYEYTGASPKIRFYAYNTSFVQQQSGSLTGEAGNTITALSMAGQSGENIYVGYAVASTTKIRLALIDSTCAQAVAPIDVETIALPVTEVGVCRYDASNCMIAYSVVDTVMSRTTTYQVSNAGVVNALSPRGTWNARLISRPFMLNGKCYFAANDGQVATFGQFNGAYSFLAEAETSGTSTTQPHRYVGKIEHLLGGLYVSAFIANAATVSSTEVLLPLSFMSDVPTLSAVYRCGTRLVSCAVGTSLPTDMWRSVSFGQDAFIACGVLSGYDGRAAFDYGFFRQPIWKTHTI